MFGVSEHAVLAFGPKETAKRKGVMSRRGDCTECGRVGITLISRGLCSTCYRKARALEDLAKDREEVIGRILESDDDPGYVTDDYEALLEDGVNERLVAVGEDQGPAVVDRSDPNFSEVLDAVLAGLRTFLISKNTAYGNSALEPLRVFSKADPMEQIRVRIDDKLSRLLRGDDCGEDTEMDLLGYLTLLQVARRWQCTSVATGAKARDAAKVNLNGASRS